MPLSIESEPLSRRAFVRNTSMLAASTLAGGIAGRPAADAAPSKTVVASYPHPLLTASDDYYDVSRGNPKPHSLVGEALVEARLTDESWRLEIVADPFTSELVKEPATVTKALTLDDGTALDLPALIELGKKHSVRFLKAIQCLNIAAPLGQGLWEGVPLREVLRLCGTMKNVRRIYYWGYHNNDPKQVFQSSLSYTEAMETPPGDLPPFLAYRLNGKPIPLKRGGPVRLIVPWAHGFKSIKWLQRIAVTNDFKANDGALHISGYEMLKGLSGITTHESEAVIEIYPNTQDIASLASVIESRLADAANPLRHGFLMAGHGLYTWGENLAAARRQIEVLEFLFEVVTQKRLLTGSF